MTNDKVVLIGGKNNEHIRRVLVMFKNIVYIEVIKLNDLTQEAEKTLNESTHIFILYKEDDEEFQKRFPEMYANKKPVCMNVSEGMTEYRLKKVIENSFKPYIKTKTEEIMDELKISREEEIKKPLFDVKCINCGKVEQYTAGVGSKRMPICEDCRKIRKEVKRGSE